MQYWMSIMRLRFIAYNYWLYEDCFNLITVSANRALTIFGLASCITPRDARRHQLIIELSATFLGQNGCDINATISWKCASMEHQRVVALHLGKCKRHTAIIIHNHTISLLSRQKWLRQHRCYALSMSINAASSNLGLASWIFKGLCYDINRLSNCRPPF